MSEQISEVKFYDKNSIAERYGIGVCKAMEVIRAIKDTIGEGCFPVKGKVLPAELEYWENKYHHMTPVSEKKEEPSSIQFDMSTAKLVAEEILSAVYHSEQTLGDLSRCTGEDLSQRLHFVLSFYGTKYGVKVG